MLFFFLKLSIIQKKSRFKRTSGLGRVDVDVLNHSAQREGFPIPSLVFISFATSATKLVNGRVLGDPGSKITNEASV